MKLIFLTDGPDRIVRLGRQVIQLRHTTPRNMATAERISGLVIHALRHIGQAQVTDAIIDALRTRLSDSDKSQLLQDSAYAPRWMSPMIQRIAKSSVTT